MKTQTDRPRTARSAFTLLEVMFAMVAFCTAIFVILALVSNSLANARRLQRPMVDAGVLAAELSQTNQLVEGVKSGSLDDLLGNSYQGYTWTRDIEEVQTNKLFPGGFHRSKRFRRQAGRFQNEHPAVPPAIRRRAALMEPRWPDESDQSTCGSGR